MARPGETQEAGLRRNTKMWPVSGTKDVTASLYRLNEIFATQAHSARIYNNR